MKKLRSMIDVLIGLEAARIFFAFSCALIVSIACSTTVLDRIFGYEHLMIVNYSASPIEWLAFVLIMYLVLNYHRRREQSTVTGSHLFVQSIAGIAVIVTAGFAIFFTHPDDVLYHQFEQFIAAYHITGGPLFAAFIATLIVLPFFPAYVFIDPKNAIARWRSLVIIFFALLGCFLSIVLEALYSKIALPYIVDLLAKILLLFSSNVYANAPRNIISIDGFRVIIGPACVGLTYIFLFLLFFGYFLFGLLKKRKVRIASALLVCVLGLCAVFFLNIMRIVSLLLIGRTYPHLALTLFHSVIGSIYFFLFFILYFPFVRWWICKEKSGASSYRTST